MFGSSTESALRVPYSPAKRIGMKQSEAIGIGVGVAIGVAIGAALDNITAGIGVGIALAIAMGLAFRKPTDRR